MSYMKGNALGSFQLYLQTLAKTPSEGKRFYYLTAYSLSWREVMEETQGRNLDTGTEAKNMDLISILLPWLTQLSLLIGPKADFPH